MKPSLLAALLVFMTTTTAFRPSLRAGSFGDDVAFLRQHTEILVLSDRPGAAKVALSAAWQGRVMTSSASGDAGPGFGWINRELIASRRIQPHMNAFGGEDRFWLGPEGGQYSIFFAKGAKFELADWQTPAPIDTLPFQLASQSGTKATFTATFALTNYSGSRFDVAVNREVRLLPAGAVWKQLGLKPADGVSLVAFETASRIRNAGRNAWKKETGLLSIWILGMFTPSPSYLFCGLLLLRWSYR